MLTRPIGDRGYALIRTSKEVQDRRSQILKIEKWLKDRGLVPVEWVEDTGSRDLSHTREGYQRLLELVDRRMVDWVAIAERDRLGYADLWEYAAVIHRFRQHGTQLWSVSDDQDLCNGDRIEPVIAALACDKSQHEQRENSDRTHRAKQAAVIRGEWTGGKPAWAYDLCCRNAQGILLWRLIYEPGLHRRRCVYPDGRVERYDGEFNVPGRSKGLGERLYPEVSQDPVLLGWVRKVFRWYADGASANSIALQLTDAGVPAPYSPRWFAATVNGILRNPVYTTGVMAWNKQGHGRFLELVDGQLTQVERVEGRTKGGRKRDPKDYVQAPPNPANAIIDMDTWNAVQARLVSQPHLKHKPRSQDLFLSGLIVCADCNTPMTAWSQRHGYRCQTNRHGRGACRCNKTDHDIVEELVLMWLEDSQQSLSLLYDDADHCREVCDLEQQSEPLILEYCRRLGQLWQDAKTRDTELKVWTHQQLVSHGKAIPRLTAQLEALEAEKTRLVRRLGLLDDEDAARAVADRILALTAELRALRAQIVADPLDTLRARLTDLLTRLRHTRAIMADTLPRLKGEALRKVIKQIRVYHEERLMGKLRSSRLVRVEIIPADVPSMDSPRPDVIRHALARTFDVLKPVRGR